MDTLVIDWNGAELPEAFRDLPPGRYLLEPMEEVISLTAEEDAGIVFGLKQLEDGEVCTLEEALAYARAGRDRR